MSDKRKCAKALKQIVGEIDNRPILCAVKQVTGYSCTVITDQGVELPNIKINGAIEGKKGLLITPKVDSQVWVSMSDELNGYVCLFSEIEKVLLTIGERSIEMDKQTIIFNAGDNKGLVKAQEMVFWMEKVHQDISSLASLLSTAIVSGNGAPLGIVFSPKTPSPSVADFTNDKIKH